MNHARRKKYRAMTIHYLKEIRDDLDSVIKELESGPRREIDIGASHAGDSELIHEVLEVWGDKLSGKWRELQRIYCSAQRCPLCPHGPFWYRYRANKRNKTITVIYEGKLFFDYEAVKRMDVKPPLFVGTIEDAMKWSENDAQGGTVPQEQGEEKGED